MSDVSNHASIVVTIGGQGRRYDAYVTSAPARLDAPSTVTLYASKLADVAAFAADEVALDAASARCWARLILVDATELAWQRARCREARHLLVPADPWLVGATTLQHWLWRRLRGCIGSCDIATWDRPMARELPDRRRSPIPTPAAATTVSLPVTSRSSVRRAHPLPANAQLLRSFVLPQSASSPDCQVPRSGGSSGRVPPTQTTDSRVVAVA